MVLKKLLTRGASPLDLDENSEWENGPEFLSLPLSEWPSKSAKEIATIARENINKLQKKEVYWRKASPGESKVGSMPSSKSHFSERERGHPKKHLSCHSDGRDFPEHGNRQVVFRDKDSGLLVCGGRVQSFEKDKVYAPTLPYGTWASTLLAQEGHGESHDRVAGTLLKMRKKAWIIKGQRVVDRCIHCRKLKAKKCQQVKSDLPPERTGPAAPFQFTTVDLLGPYHVKDDIKSNSQGLGGSSLAAWLTEPYT